MEVATTVSNTYDAAIEACARCSQACLEAFEACMSNPGLESRAKVVKMLVECARACDTAAGEMASNAVFAREYAKICASVCELCAKNCDMFRDDHCRLCAEECRACAKECREMS